jgi:hypothetical protein
MKIPSRLELMGHIEALNMVNKNKLKGYIDCLNDARKTDAKAAVKTREPLLKRGPLN